MRYSLHENIAGSLPVYIGNNVFIGMGATILMGADIGDNCIIGAGSVVKGTIPPNSVVAGNPAEYSCAMKSHFRKFGNQMSGSGNHLCNYASLLA